MEKEEFPPSSAPMVSGTDPGIASKTDQTKDPVNTPKKKYYAVTIPKSLISDYKKRNGVRIVLSFHDGNGIHVPLIFTGFGKDRLPVITHELARKGNDSIESRNVFFGIIFSDDKGKLLHDLFTSGPEKDWTLTPEENDTCKDYVSYALSDDTTLLRMGKLNPSPPA